KPLADALKSLDEAATNAADGSRTDLGLGPLNRELARLFAMISSGDDRPTVPLETAVQQNCQQVAKKLAQWQEINAKDLADANALLHKSNGAALPVVANVAAMPPCAK